MLGTVRWFSPKRGFEFIAQEDGSDVFVHFSAIQEAGFKKLTAGQKVEFDIVHNLKGPYATNVVKIE